MTPSLDRLDLQTEDTLLLYPFEEFDETTETKTGHSTSPVTATQAPPTECLEKEIRSVPPANLALQDEAQIFAMKSQVMHDTKERDPDVFSRRPKKMVVARTQPRSPRKTVRGRHRCRNQQASHMPSRITEVKRSRQKQKVPRNCFQDAVYKTEEPTSEFKTVEDGLRVSEWLRRLQRHWLRGLKRQPLWQFRLFTASPDQTRNELNVSTGRGLCRASMRPGKMLNLYRASSSPHR